MRFSAGVFADVSSPPRAPLRSRLRPGSIPPIPVHPAGAQFRLVEETRCTRPTPRACCHPRTDDSGTNKKDTQPPPPSNPCRVTCRRNSPAARQVTLQGFDGGGGCVSFLFVPESSVRGWQQARGVGRVHRVSSTKRN